MRILRNEFGNLVLIDFEQQTAERVKELTDRLMKETDSTLSQICPVFGLEPTRSGANKMTSHRSGKQPMSKENWLLLLHITGELKPVTTILS